MPGSSRANEEGRKPGGAMGADACGNREFWVAGISQTLTS